MAGFGASATAKETRRLSSRVTRLLQRLHIRKLIAKIPRSRRWRITEKGSRILGALQAYFDQTFPTLYAQGPFTVMTR